MFYTRRDVGKFALAALPMAKAFGAIDSKFNGVQIGAITYSFRSMTDTGEVIKAMVEIGLGEAELMSSHAESAAGAPVQNVAAGGRRGEMTPEQQAAMRAHEEELKKWRSEGSMDKFKDVRKTFDAAGRRLAR